MNITGGLDERSFMIFFGESADFGTTVWPVDFLFLADALALGEAPYLMKKYATMHRCKPEIYHFNSTGYLNFI